MIFTSPFVKPTSLFGRASLWRSRLPTGLVGDCWPTWLLVRLSLFPPRTAKHQCCYQGNLDDLFRHTFESWVFSGLKWCFSTKPTRMTFGSRVLWRKRLERSVLSTRLSLAEHHPAKTDSECMLGAQAVFADPGSFPGRAKRLGLKKHVLHVWNIIVVFTEMVLQS